MARQKTHGLREQRTVARTVEARVAGDDGPTTISGYAALFETPATIGGQFVEVIERGAFDDTIGDDVRVLFNHDPSLLLGRTASGTASLEVDDEGLRYTVTPPETQTGRDVLALVARGDVDGSSFGFRVLEDRWVPAERDALPVRHVERVALLDVSPVTVPAYAETTAEVRSAAAACVSTAHRVIDDERILAARRLTWARHRLECVAA